PINCRFESPRLRFRVSFLLRALQMATGKENGETEDNSKQSRSFYVQSVISCDDFPIWPCVNQMLSVSSFRRQRCFVSAAPQSTIGTLDSPRPRRQCNSLVPTKKQRAVRLPG